MNEIKEAFTKITPDRLDDIKEELKTITAATTSVRALLSRLLITCLVVKN